MGHLVENINIRIPELAVLVVSMLPVSELRGAIPLAVFKFHFPIWKAFLLSVAGNLVPIVPILLFLDRIHRLLYRTSWGKKLFDKFSARTRKRGQIVEKYEALGLIAFVAIPLPVTGAWTGAFAAFLFDIPFKKAFPAIAMGVLIAGFIVSAFVMAGYIGAVAVGAILLFLVLKEAYKRL